MTGRLTPPAPVPHGFISSTAARLADHHSDLLAFGWRHRGDRLGDASLDFADLCASDDRLQAALESLALLGPSAGQHARAMLDEPVRPEDLFAIAGCAFALQDADLLDACTAMAAALPELLPPLVAAMEWADVSPLLETAIDALPPAARLRLTGLRHRELPGLPQRVCAWLPEAELDPPAVCAALQMISHLGRADWAAAAVPHLAHDAAEVRVAAARVVLGFSGDAEGVGVPGALDVLGELVLSPSMSLRSAAVQCLAWHAPQAIAKVVDALDPRLRCQALGWLGRSGAVAALAEAMREPALARVAASALALITGCDPVRGGWQGASREPAGARDEGDDGMPDRDPDAGLPWPDPSAWSTWWCSNAQRFAAHKRHLAGRPLTLPWLSTVLKTGPLPWRALAAGQLHALTGGALFPTHLPAAAQRARFHELP